MNPAEQNASAPWRSRWYSAAKRFGLAVIAAALLSFLLTEATAAIASGVSETDAIFRIMSLSALAEGVLLCLPVLGAVWGFVRPREYRKRPSLGARASFASLSLLVLFSGAAAGCILLKALGVVRLDSERILAIRERVEAGDPSVLARMRRSDVGYVFDDGATLLLSAVASCDSNMVAALVARGADVNRPFDYPRYSEHDRLDSRKVGVTPLSAALARLSPGPGAAAAPDAAAAPEDTEERDANAKSIVRILLDGGADPSDALVAVSVVPAKHFDEMLDLLIRAGADPDKPYRDPAARSVADVIEARYALEKDRMARRRSAFTPQESERYGKAFDERVEQMDYRIRRIRAAAGAPPAAERRPPPPKAPRQ